MGTAQLPAGPCGHRPLTCTVEAAAQEEAAELRCFPHQRLVVRREGLCKGRGSEALLGHTQAPEGGSRTGNPGHPLSELPLLDIQLMLPPPGSIPGGSYVSSASGPEPPGSGLVRNLLMESAPAALPASPGPHTVDLMPVRSSTGTRLTAPSMCCENTSQSRSNRPKENLSDTWGSGGRGQRERGASRKARASKRVVGPGEGGARGGWGQ